MIRALKVSVKIHTNKDSCSSSFYLADHGSLEGVLRAAEVWALGRMP